MSKYFLHLRPYCFVNRNRNNDGFAVQKSVATRTFIRLYGMNKFPRSKYLIRSINARLKNDLAATIK